MLRAETQHPRWELERASGPRSKPSGGAHVSRRDLDYGAARADAIAELFACEHWG